MSPSQASILLIENNIFLGGLLSNRLKKYDLDIHTVKNAKEGLKSIEKNKCNIVLLDVPLSDVIVFFGVLRTVIEKTKISSPSVIVLSNVESDKDIEKISNMGAAAYLIKAYTDTDEIVNKIKTVLADKNNIVLAKNPSDIEPLTKKGVNEIHDEILREEKSVVKIAQVPLVDENKKIKGEIEKITILAEKNEQDDLSIVNLLDYVIEFGSLANASDIHFRPSKEGVIVRMRIDGILQDVFNLPKKIHEEVITRIKVLGGMRTDEHQSAQDGRFRTNIKRLFNQFDIRVSMVPTYHGEDAVLRLLIEQASINNLTDIPFSDSDRKRINNAINKPYGMILATGPTGSGKTTSLYTILKELNTKDVSIITIEDPIEYSLGGINQIQVNNETKLTFANGLRSILRQDPDIIMVGEIRDKETAGIAVNAALTGHKLLSTLHTNDAATTLPRLLDMGVEPFLIASTVNIAIGQRLVRMLCQKCKTKKTLGAVERSKLSDFIALKHLEGKTFYDAKGCISCGTTGYKGRLGIYEVMDVDEDIRNAIIQRKDADSLKKIAIQNGMTTLIEDGIIKASQGLTTIEEILRVAQE